MVAKKLQRPYSWSKGVQMNRIYEASYLSITRISV